MSSVVLPSSGPRKKRHLILKIGALLVIFLVVLVGSAFVWWTKVLIPRLRRDAEQRWAAIGRQMPEATKALDRVEENESLRALTRDLQPFGVNSFYKAHLGQHDPNKINIPSEITGVFNPMTSDEIGPAAQESAYLNEHVADLDRLYEGVLQRELPVWYCDPQDRTFEGANYLVARRVSQLICADAFHKLEHGDEKGAAKAVTAGLKITVNLGEQSTLVTEMVRVNIEGLFARVMARLPEDLYGSTQLAVDVEANRERWRRAVRGETQLLLHLGDDEARRFYRGGLIQNIRRCLNEPFLETEWTLFVAGIADQIRASEHISTSVLSDLGEKEMHESAIGHESLFPNYFGAIWGDGWHRSWVRVNATLLLREQAEVIRMTRARLEAGESGNLGDRESFVIPGAKWRVTADATTNSASFQLTPLPPWTADCRAVDQEFFLLPLDGSKSWTFRTPQLQSQREHVATR